MARGEAYFAPLLSNGFKVVVPGTWVPSGCLKTTTNEKKKNNKTNI